MADAFQRHDISDAAWSLLEPRLPGRKGVWGGVAHDNRRFINAVCWILRTGAPWRDLPPAYGDWKNTHRRFCRWRDSGAWEALLEPLIIDPDYEWLMIDAATSRFIPTPQVPGVVIKPWALQKGAQYQAASGRGCAWHADPSHYCAGDHCRLYAGCTID